MRLREQMRSIDVERVILVPVMFFFLCLTLFALFAGLNHASSSALVDYLHLIYLVLLTSFYFMAAIFLLIRSPARAHSEGVAPRIRGVSGNVSPTALRIRRRLTGSRRSGDIRSGANDVGDVVQPLLPHCARPDFGVEAKVRNLVQHGPYRFIRNPLYVAEMITLIGAVCFFPSLPKVMILIAVGAIQVYRAVQEERLLEEHLPEYAAYKLQTKRFVPGLF